MRSPNRPKQGNTKAITNRDVIFGQKVARWFPSKAWNRVNVTAQVYADIN